MMAPANPGKPNHDRQHVYAILRVDAFQGLEVPIEDKITLKRIVRSQDVAKAEVDRLNGLQASKDCYYFHQVTRLDKAPTGVPEPLDSTAAETQNEMAVKQ